MFNIILYWFLVTVNIFLIGISEFVLRAIIILNSEKENSQEYRFKSIIGIQSFSILLLFSLILLISKRIASYGAYEVVFIVILIFSVSAFMVFLNSLILHIKESTLNDLYLISRVLYYPLFPITLLVSLFLKKYKSDIVSHNFPSYISEKQLKKIIEKDSELEKDEKEMITSIIGFSNIKASEIMIPRTSIIAFDENITYDEILEYSKQKTFSRVPVYSDNLDNITGIFYIKDLIGLGRNEFEIKKLIRKPIFMPETVKLDELLKNMIEKKMQMIIILDEYGGTAGMVTMEDIIEEIIGEIEDEFDKHSKEIEKVDKNTYKIKGSVEIEIINEKLGIKIPKGETETIAGFLLSQLERIPEKGETYNFNNVHFRIIEADERRIKWILMNIIQDKK